MIERVRLGPKSAQFPRGIMGERSTNRYIHPDGYKVYAEPGHINKRSTKLVPIYDASTELGKK